MDHNYMENAKFWLIIDSVRQKIANLSFKIINK